MDSPETGEGLQLMLATIRRSSTVDSTFSFLTLAVAMILDVPWAAGQEVAPVPLIQTAHLCHLLQEPIRFTSSMWWVFQLTLILTLRLTLELPVSCELVQRFSTAIDKNRSWYVTYSYITLLLLVAIYYFREAVIGKGRGYSVLAVIVWYWIYVLKSTLWINNCFISLLLVPFVVQSSRDCVQGNLWSSANDTRMREGSCTREFQREQES
jgi:hypothetical protein